MQELPPCKQVCKELLLSRQTTGVAYHFLHPVNIPIRKNPFLLEYGEMTCIVSWDYDTSFKEDLFSS